MYYVTKIFRFSYAHRILGHPKCGNLHGHNAKVEVTYGGEKLDKQGMLIDFDMIKEVMHPILEKLDHSVLFSQKDKDLFEVMRDYSMGRFVEMEHSTAEDIAHFIYSEVSPIKEGKLGSGRWMIYSVKVWETEENCAEYVNGVK